MQRSTSGTDLPWELRENPLTEQELRGKGEECPEEWLGTTGDAGSKTASSVHRISYHSAFHLLALKALANLDGNILGHSYFINMLVF